MVAGRGETWCTCTHLHGSTVPSDYGSRRLPPGAWSSVPRQVARIGRSMTARMDYLLSIRQSAQEIWHLVTISARSHHKPSIVGPGPPIPRSWEVRPGTHIASWDPVAPVSQGCSSGGCEGAGGRLTNPSRPHLEHSSAVKIGSSALANLGCGEVRTERVASASQPPGTLSIWTPPHSSRAGPVCDWMDPAVLSIWREYFTLECCSRAEL